MYWCCGKTDIEAKGCQKTKHFCEEETEKNEMIKEVTNDSEKTEFCTVCKKNNHLAEDCLVDPNSPKKILGGKSISPTKFSQKTIIEVYKKQQKAYKIIKYREKVTELKDSLKRTNSSKPVKIKTKDLFETKKPTFSPVSLQPDSLENSGFVDHFPSILSRKISSSAQSKISQL